MATFPASLPNPLVRNFTEGPPNLVLRTQMDQGPAKLRRRFTAGVRPVTVNFVLSEAQVATLDTFFITNTAGGSVQFTMENPRTDTSESFRFVQPPQYSQISHDAYDVTLELEQMP